MHYRCFLIQKLEKKIKMYIFRTRGAIYESFGRAHFLKASFLHHSHQLSHSNQYFLKLYIHSFLFLSFSSPYPPLSFFFFCFDVFFTRISFLLSSLVFFLNCSSFSFFNLFSFSSPLSSPSFSLPFPFSFPPLPSSPLSPYT